MWQRKELKAKGKAALKANYWRSVLIAVIMTVLVSGSAVGIRSGALSGGMSGAVVGSSLLPGHNDTYYDQNYNTDTETTEEKTYDADTKAKDVKADDTDASTKDIKTDDADAEAGNFEHSYAYNARTDIDAAMVDLVKLAGISDEQIKEFGGIDEDEILTLFMIVIAVLIGLLLIVTVISCVINIFIINPFKVSCYAFFMENTRTENTNISALERGFTPKYGRNVGAMLLKSIYLFFWTMLFVIPGIIKTYSYRMLPYILADEPELSANEAITRSREMMKGNKWRAFVIDLSFIGWHILSMLTCGLVGIFYVNPYMYGTDAALYNALKGEELAEPAEPAED